MFPQTASQRSVSGAIRPPAVAGAFYPANPHALRRAVATYLAQANQIGPTPKGLIVPHAGYAYSGPVAGSGYALVKPIGDIVKRVVLIGPSHHVPFRGLAAPTSTAFATPLGLVPIDEDGIAAAAQFPQVQFLDEAHQYEHSLEVQLPFLQMTISEFMLVPLVVGQADPESVAQVLDHLWGGDETLVVVSSDMSHYHDYWTARRIDSETSEFIERCQWDQLNGQRACGFHGITGLLKVAQVRGYKVKAVDLRNSGDTSGMKDQVVGYGSYVVYK